MGLTLYRAPSALQLNWLLSWGVAPGYYIPRPWRFGTFGALGASEHSAPSALQSLPAGYLGRGPRLLHFAPLVLMKKHRLSCGRHSVKNLSTSNIIPFAQDKEKFHEKISSRHPCVFCSRRFRGANSFQSIRGSTHAAKGQPPGYGLDAQLLQGKL